MLSIAPVTGEGWKASWIWDEGEHISPKNYYMYVRREINVDDKPVKSFEVWISADSRYQFHVNGKLTGRGPAPCDPRWQYYDVYDIKEYMLAISTDPGFKKAGLEPAINKIRVNFKDLPRHHFHPGMPRTTNIGEGLFSRIDSKINQADGYKCHATALATLKMIIMHYRFKTFTDCRKKNKHKNGKSPLDLAGVDTSKINWIKFSKKNL